MMDLLRQLFFSSMRSVGLINAWAHLKEAQDHAEADEALWQNFLGTTYAEGKDTPRDYVQAYKWYSLAATRTSRADFGEKDQIYKGRDCSMSEYALRDLAVKMTPQQVAAAKRLVSEWHPDFSYSDKRRQEALRRPK